MPFPHHRRLAGALALAACLTGAAGQGSGQSLAADGMAAMSGMTGQAAAGAAPAAIAAEQPFLAGNDAAMAKMMAGMAPRPTGDIDKDFVDMMVPHHQGAIDMAELELRYGKNDHLKALAQEIIVTQQQEIAAMRQVVNEPLPPSVPSPIAPATASASSN